MHGSYRNPDGKTIDHAWVERRGMVMDLANNLVTTKAIWYQRAKAKRRYSDVEAAVQEAQSEHWGPWPAQQEKRLQE